MTNVYYLTALNNLDSVTTPEQSSQDERISFSTILKHHIGHAIVFSRLAVIRSANEFRNSFSALMKSLQVFVDGRLTSAENYVTSSLLGVVCIILEFICLLTDQITLIPMFIDTGLVEASIRWIGTDMFTSHISSVGTSIFLIAYNLSREKVGLKQLRSMNAFEILMKRKQRVLQEDDEKLKEVFGTTLLALATSDKESEENIKIMLNTSTNLYKLCMAAGHDSELKHGGFHVSELLELLYRAFSNTIVRKFILQMKINEQLTSIQEFEQLFLSIYGALLDPEPDELEKRAVQYLLKILLQISSYPEYLKELKDNIQFCVIIESLKNRPMQDEAWRIWCNIQQKIPSHETEREKTARIYVSYDWADEEFCQVFVGKLREKITIPISVNYEDGELSDETWDDSCRTIESATVIIALVSTAYGESTEKFLEIAYVISSNKSRGEQESLILVEAESNYSFNRDWMHDLLHEQALIGHDNDIGSMADKVCEQIVRSNKSLLQYVIRSNTNRHGNTATSGEAVSKAVSTIDSAFSPTTAYILNDSVYMADSSHDLLATRKYKSYSIVSGLDRQTGSAGSSTWV